MFAYCRQDIDSPVTILNVSGMKKEEDQEASGIRQNMALATFDLLSSVITGNSPAFRGFHRLAINHARARGGLMPFDLPKVHDQYRVHRFEQSGIRPCVKVAPDGQERWKAFRQQTPRTPTRGDIEYRVYNLRISAVRGRPPRFAGGHERHNQSPPGIPHIRWISQSLPAMFVSGNTSLCHQSLHPFAKTDESQHAGIVQKLLDQALKKEPIRLPYFNLSNVRSIIEDWWSSTRTPLRKPLSAVMRPETGLMDSTCQIREIEQRIVRIIAEIGEFTTKAELLYSIP